jgi:tetratricopeptide (TPR) repeat protein
MRVALIILLMSLSYQGMTQNLYHYYGNIALQKYEARDFQGAISYMNRIINMYPDSTLPHWSIGDCYVAMNNFEESIKHFNRALEMGDSSKLVLGSRGCAYRKLNQFDLAEVDFKTGVRLHPLETELFLNLGILYNELGRFEETKLALDSLGSFSLGYYEGYFIRGFANQSLQHYEAAIEDYVQYIEKDSRESWVQFELAECYKALGRTTEMCETLRDYYERSYMGGKEYHDGDCVKILKHRLQPPPEDIPSEILPPPQEIRFYMNNSG